VLSGSSAAHSAGLVISLVPLEQCVGSEVFLPPSEAKHEERRTSMQQLIPSPSRPLSDVDTQLKCEEMLDNPV
jgi:hypothetical protein